VTPSRLSIAAGLLVCLAVLAYAGHWAVGEWQYRALLADRALIAGDRDVSVKAEQSCPDPGETLTFVVFGQSNAANHGGARLTAPDDSFDFYDGRCFEGHDPQFSATGKGGSLWPAFARAMRESGETRPVLMANVAVGNTAISEWLPSGKHAEFLQAEARALRAEGYRIAAFLFLQGESDRQTPEGEYRRGLEQLSDMTGPDAPLIVSNTSVCALHEGGETPAAALSMARAKLADERDTVFIGPDTDALGNRYRYDGCHFNREGLEALGGMWAGKVADILN